jgi:hypothetical protein
MRIPAAGPQLRDNAQRSSQLRAVRKSGRTVFSGQRLCYKTPASSERKHTPRRENSVDSPMTCYKSSLVRRADK